jgi:hypothetical protein
MRVVERLLVIAAASAVLACDRDANPPSAPEASTPDLATAFITDQPAQAKGLNGATVKPILTVGDPLPGQQSNLRTRSSGYGLPSRMAWVCFRAGKAIDL